jgi:hypothetical protein
MHLMINGTEREAPLVAAPNGAALDRTGQSKVVAVTTADPVVGQPSQAVTQLRTRYHREHSRDMGTEFAHEIAQEGCSRIIGDLTIAGEHLG